MTSTANLFFKQTEEHVKNLHAIIDKVLKEKVFQSDDNNDVEEYHVIDNKYFPASLLPIVFEGFIRSIKGIDYYAYENHSPFEKNDRNYRFLRNIRRYALPGSTYILLVMAIREY